MEKIYKYTDMEILSENHVDKSIIIDGRVNDIKCKKTVAFIVLRKKKDTIQCVLEKSKFCDENKYKDLSCAPTESRVAFYGKLKKLPEKVERIQSCSYDRFEFLIDDYRLLSKSYVNKLPIQINNDLDNVQLSTRLDNRCLDLRTRFNRSIFKLQSGICELFREYLSKENFMEVHTPKLIGVASEGGSQVFPVEYFGKQAYLAQSPQLYKQMCINSDLEKVFEIGSVFRAENSLSHRHLTEFIGLDAEMEIPYGESYHYIMKLLWSLVKNIYVNLRTKYKEEYEYIKSQVAFEDLLFPDEPLIMDFVTAVELLKEHGYTQDYLMDLSTENEKKLGQIIKMKHNSDVFILNKYPTNVRPFYTMVCENDEKYSNSYDMIMRGEEICSGSQRIHDYVLLKKKISERNIREDSLLDYLQSFSYGSVPHGGFGLGLERLLMLVCNIGNIRKCSLYPRDPHRLTP